MLFGAKTTERKLPSVVRLIHLSDYSAMKKLISSRRAYAMLHGRYGEAYAPYGTWAFQDNPYKG